MLGTQSPTKIPCCFATSGFPKNHKETLSKKLKKAATKKYFLLLMKFLSIIVL